MSKLNNNKTICREYTSKSRKARTSKHSTLKTTNKKEIDNKTNSLKTDWNSNGKKDADPTKCDVCHGPAEPDPNPSKLPCGTCVDCGRNICGICFTKAIQKGSYKEFFEYHGVCKYCLRKRFQFRHFEQSEALHSDDDVDDSVIYHYVVQENGAVFGID
jgi:hypothetical protein